jgi:hypothetical protein
VVLLFTVSVRPPPLVAVPRDSSYLTIETIGSTARKGDLASPLALEGYVAPALSLRDGQQALRFARALLHSVPGP